MSLNGHSLEHDLDELDDRVRRVETHLANVEIEHKHTRGTLDEVRADTKALRTLAERAVGGWIALGIVWTVLTFAVALLMRR